MKVMMRWTMGLSCRPLSSVAPRPLMFYVCSKRYYRLCWPLRFVLLLHIPHLLYQFILITDGECFIAFRAAVIDTMCYLHCVLCWGVSCALLVLYCDLFVSTFVLHSIWFHHSNSHWVHKPWMCCMLHLRDLSKACGCLGCLEYINICSAQFRL